MLPMKQNIVVFVCIIANFRRGANLFGKIDVAKVRSARESFLQLQYDELAIYDMRKVLACYKRDYLAGRKGRYFYQRRLRNES